MSTIVAIASALGPGGVAVIRLSGQQVVEIAERLTGCRPKPRHAHFVHFKDLKGAELDQGLMIWFPGPHSYTGEDVLELHTHGGEVVPRSVIQACMDLGARLAEPGEFTRRAFSFGKLDLAQAEAVADLISAGSIAAAKGALRSLNGSFSNKVSSLQENLTAIRIQIEGGMDFPEEHLETESVDYAQHQLRLIGQQLEQLLKDAEQCHTLRAGCRVVLMGPPNVGKSSLLNALARDDLAIVSSVAGTTRDTIRTQLELKGVRLELVDTAGIRSSEELVEKLGIERTWAAAQNADLVIHLQSFDVEKLGMKPEWEDILKDVPALTVCTKADLVPQEEREKISSIGLWVSAQTGEGLESLEEAIIHQLGGSATIEPAFLPRARHMSALQGALTHVGRALESTQEEFFAEELRLTQKSLDTILGEVASDELLGEIFSRFCIGK